MGNLHTATRPRPTLAAIMAGVPPERLAQGCKPRLAAYATARYSQPDGSETWRYRDTDIVTRLPSGRYRLDSGGWRTMTTRSKIAEFSPARLAAIKGAWHLGNGAGPAFFDGIEVDSAGLPVGKGTARRSESELARIARAQAAIKKFCKRMLTASKLPLPDAGDCWLCSMFDAAAPGSLGAEHLRQHVREGYLHGSLIVNACRAAGWGDYLISRLLHSAPGSRERRDGARMLRRYLALHAYGISP